MKDAVARKALEEHRAETLQSLEEEQRIREEKVWIPQIDVEILICQTSSLNSVRTPTFHDKKYARKFMVKHPC